MNYFRNSGEEFLVNQISLWMLGGCVERKGSVFNTVLVDPVILANVDQVMAFQVIISFQNSLLLTRQQVCAMIDKHCILQEKILFTRCVKLAGDLLKRDHKARQERNRIVRGF